MKKINIGQSQNDDDGEATDKEDLRRRIARLELLLHAPPAKQQRHNQMVRGHDGQRHARHDHHGGGRRQAADHRQHRHPRRIGLQRQSQHRHIAVDRAVRKGEAPGDGERNDKQIDRDQIEREQPRRRFDVGLVAIFNHHNVELARQ